jgi:hypothetical protein
VIQLDGDGQHEAKCLIDLVDAIREGSADLVQGTRFLRPPVFRAAVARRFGILVFRSIVSAAVGKRISDPTSGFKALNRETLKLYVTEAYPPDFPDADVLIMTHYAGLRIKETPVIMYSQGADGKSMHGGWKPVHYAFKMLLSIFVTVLRRGAYAREARNRGK